MARLVAATNTVAGAKCGGTNGVTVGTGRVETGAVPHKTTRNTGFNLELFKCD